MTIELSRSVEPPSSRLRIRSRKYAVCLMCQLMIVSYIARRSGSLRWWEIPWKLPFTPSRNEKSRAVWASPNMNVATRVVSVQNARSRMSSIRRTCSSWESGMPGAGRATPRSPWLTHRGWGAMAA